MDPLSKYPACRSWPVVELREGDIMPTPRFPPETAEPAPITANLAGPFPGEPQPSTMHAFASDARTPLFPPGSSGIVAATFIETAHGALDAGSGTVLLPNGNGNANANANANAGTDVASATSDLNYIHLARMQPQGHCVGLIGLPQPLSRLVPRIRHGRASGDTGIAQRANRPASAACAVMGPLASLRHPHLVRLVGLLATPECEWAAFLWPDQNASAQSASSCVSLSSILESGVPLPLADVLCYARQLASTLHYVATVLPRHQCLIRSADVLVANRHAYWIPFRTRLVDFCTNEPELLLHCAPEAVWPHSIAALSTLRSSLHPHSHSHSHPQTHTPTPTPPQQRRSSSDNRFDPVAAISVFSFGMLLWEMLTCQIPISPIDRTTYFIALDRGARLQIPDFVPDSWRKCINMCWAQNPKERPTWLHLCTWFQPKYDEHWTTPASIPSSSTVYTDFSSISSSALSPNPRSAFPFIPPPPPLDQFGDAAFTPQPVPTYTPTPAPIPMPLSGRYDSFPLPVPPPPSECAGLIPQPATPRAPNSPGSFQMFSPSSPVESKSPFPPTAVSPPLSDSFDIVPQPVSSGGPRTPKLPDFSLHSFAPLPSDGSDFMPQPVGGQGTNHLPVTSGNIQTGDENAFGLVSQPYSSMTVKGRAHNTTRFRRSLQVPSITQQYKSDPQFPSLDLCDDDATWESEEKTTFQAADNTYKSGNITLGIDMMSQLAIMGNSNASFFLSSLHQSHESLMDIGLYMFELREYMIAYEYFKLALERYPNHYGAHIALGLLYAEYPRAAPLTQQMDVLLLCRRQALTAPMDSKRDTISYFRNRCASQLRAPTTCGAIFFTMLATCRRLLLLVPRAPAENSSPKSETSPTKPPSSELLRYLDPHPEEDLKLLRDAVDRSQTVAEYELGLIYQHGLLPNVVIDLEMSLKMFKRAADKGHASAMCAIADFHILGTVKSIGLQPDVALAVGLYQKADSLGSSYAAYALGWCYQHGKGFHIDISTAISFYMRSAQEGNIDAQTAIGLCYLQGSGVPQSINDAHYWLRLAAEQGAAPAFYHLGMSILESKSNPTDLSIRSLTIDLYEYGLNKEESARQHRAKSLSVSVSNPTGKLMLGYKYASDANMRPSSQKDPSNQASSPTSPRASETNPILITNQLAFELFKLGAQKNHTRCRYRLALCLLESIGTQQDVKAAIEHLRVCGDNGLVEAYAKLGNIYFEGTLVPRDFSVAAKWYQQASDMGHSYSQRMMGHMLQEGLGVTKDPAEAIMRYLQAGNQKNYQINLNAGAQQDNSNTTKDAPASPTKAATSTKSHLQDAEFAPTIDIRTDLCQIIFDNGDREAQFIMGTRFATGKGVSKDMVQAFDWYKLAANQGHAEAMRTVADCFAKGLGTMRNLRSAVAWYGKAADAGDVIAQQKLDRAGSSNCASS